ncbi:MAG: alpha-E domain-containing protein [Gammaproteobacteria bacterium]
MLSRVAERIYWMARYVERAENTARMINVNTNLLLDLPRRVTLGWQPLIEITGSKKLYDEHYTEINERNVVKFLISDTRYVGSLINSLVAARENARTIRDIIPREAWEKVNDLYLHTKNQLPQALARRNRFDFLGYIISSTQGTTGLLAGTMTHNFGYDFLRIGRNLERADMTSRIIDVRSANLLPEESEDLLPYETIQWMSVLQSLSAYQNYRQQVQSRVQRGEVLKYLLQDIYFPRAFNHCIHEVQSSLKNLPRHMGPIRHLNQIIRSVETAQLDNISKKALHRYIDQLQAQLASLNETISATYFSIQEEQPVKSKKKKSKSKKSGKKSKASAPATTHSATAAN